MPATHILVVDDEPDIRAAVRDILEDEGYRVTLAEDAAAARAARAVLSVMPLDSFVEHPALRMEIVGKPKEIPPVQAEVQAEIDRAEGKSWPMGGVERFAFYDLARKAYCVIQTGERRFYGCFAFKKGVIPPDQV